MTAASRRRALRSLRRELRRRKADVLRTLARETGRSELECFTTEFVPSVAALGWLSRNGEQIHRRTAKLSGLPFRFGMRRVYETRMPLGSVLVIGTWNYPLQIAWRQIVWALFAGDRVLFKPSPYAEGSATLIAEIVATAPEWAGQFSLLPSDPAQSERVWDEIDGVIFTGSTATAQTIAQKAAERHITAIIEASGNDSIIVGSRGYTMREVEHIVWALTTHSGETCVAPKLIWLPRAQYNDQLQLLDAALSDYVATERWKGYTTPNIPKAIATYKQTALSLGATIRTEVQGQLLVVELRSAADAATLTEACLASDGIPFAPVLACVPYDDLAEPLEWSNGPFAGLGTTTFAMTSSERRQCEHMCGTSFVSHSEAVVAAGIPAIAMGGRGASGIGRSGGLELLLQLTRSRTIVSPGLGASLALPRWAIFNGKDAIGHRFLQRMMRKY
ncbi:MAG: aldehyde dehydrogenase family protein [Bacteroidetes bacterium]|nr:aldehyde dehydrogenase family protein [Bacteroidota bacterium]